MSNDDNFVAFTKRKETLLMISIISMLVSTQIYILIPNYPLIAQEFNVTHMHLGIMSGFYLLIIGLSAIPWGYISDKIENRKLLLVISVSLVILFTYLSAVAPHFIWLLICQLLAGFFLGPVIPISYSILADLFRIGERVQIFNIWGIISSIGSGIGFAGGLLLGVWSGWRSALLFGIIPLLFALLLSLFIREPPRAGAEEELYDLIILSGAKYSYKISKEGFIEIIRSKTNIFLTLQSIFTYIAWGSFSTWGIHAIALESKTSTIIATILLGIASAGNLGAFILAPIADKLRLKKPEYKAVFASTMALGEAFFLIAMFAFLPIIDFYENNLMPALRWALNIVISDSSISVAVTFGFIGIFAGSILRPIRDSIISDVNLPERRATAISIMWIFSLFGRSIGIVLTGFLSDYLNSLRLAIILSQSFMILASITFLLVILSYKSELATTKEILLGRREILKSYIEKLKKFQEPS